MSIASVLLLSEAMMTELPEPLKQQIAEPGMDLKPKENCNVRSSTSHHAVADLAARAQTRGGLPFLSALAQRRSVRAFTDLPISAGTLSNLLWAAFGVNRSTTGDPTAPYWRHAMVIDIYVARADGVWRYKPKEHILSPCSNSDIRAETGAQDLVAGAPLELIYVAHGERMDVPPEERRLHASVDTAFIGENIYLFCASEGLGTVFRGSFDSRKLAQLLDLDENQFVTFVETIGYPRS